MSTLKEWSKNSTETQDIYKTYESALIAGIVFISIAVISIATATGLFIKVDRIRPRPGQFKSNSNQLNLAGQILLVIGFISTVGTAVSFHIAMKERRDLVDMYESN